MPLDDDEDTSSHLILNPCSGCSCTYCMMRESNEEMFKMSWDTFEDTSWGSGTSSWADDDD